jgi:hypothetical protein
VGCSVPSIEKGVTVKLSRAARVAVGVVGGLVVLVGLGVWSLESEYGSGLNFSVEIEGAVHRVLEGDEQAPDPEDRRTVVFEGTEEEASAYIEQRRAEETNLVIPGLIIGVGILIVIAALIPIRKTPPNGAEAP